MQKRQSVWTQFLFGAVFGLMVMLIQQHETLYWAADEYMVGRVVGGMFGGVFLYCLAYRFWPRAK